jgi:hypothetical protein
MRQYRFVSLFICLLLLICASGSTRTQAESTAVTLTVSNPYCAQSVPASPICWINVRNISATSSDPNFLGVQITVNGKTRAFFSQFFETSVTINKNMLGKGLQVNCGLPNASGQADSGLQYHVGISGIVSGGSPTTDTANVFCPYFVTRVYMPAVYK